VSFTCPICKRTSHNPNDEFHRHCGACNQTFALKRWTLESGPEHSLDPTPGRIFEAQFPGDPVPLLYKVVQVADGEWGPTLFVEFVA
jgi:hypothetical protein